MKTQQHLSDRTHVVSSGRFHNQQIVFMDVTQLCKQQQQKDSNMFTMGAHLGLLMVGSLVKVK